MGWRMHDDLAILADLPDGSLSIDLISCTATHDAMGIIRLHIADEINAWLRAECQRESIPFDQLCKAKLVVDLHSSEIKRKKNQGVRFVFDCQSTIETDEHKCDLHLWDKRGRGKRPDKRTFEAFTNRGSSGRFRK